MRPTFRHLAEWGLLRAVLHLARQQDPPQLAVLAHRLARVTPLLLRTPYRWAARNLELVFGEHLQPEQRQRLVRMAMDNILLSHLESLAVERMAFYCPQWDRVSGLLTGQQAVIVCSIHLGCWEGTGPWLARQIGRPVAAVYRWANNPLSEREFRAIRERHINMEWIPRNALRPVMHALQNGRHLGLMVDINTREGGVVAPFLGVPALCPPGPERLARRFGCPILPMVAIREAGDTVYRGTVRMEFGDPILPYPDEPPEALMERINAAFTGWIHTYAEQYNWFHARWRSRPDGTLWRLDTPLSTIQQSRIAPCPDVAPRIRTLLERAADGSLSFCTT